MAQPRTQTQEKSPHLAILPSPGMGHLIPLVELAKRLVGYHRFTLTIVVPTDGPPAKAMKSVLEGLPAAIDHVFLPPVNFDELPEDSKPETLIAVTIFRSLPALRHALTSLASRVSLVGLVVDIFGTDAFDVARELHISSFVFIASSAMSLSLTLYLPELHETTSCEYWELTDPVKIPGCLPISGKELLDPVQDRSNDAYEWTLHNAKRCRLADGIMINSFNELEPTAIWSLQEKGAGKLRVYPVGPLVNVEPSTKVDESNCLTWLDGQAHGSVLFVSFGSGGALSSHEMYELALGLEKSRQRFLWAVRRPNDKTANATYSRVDNQNDSPFDFLPDGFLDRTRDRGLVLYSWVPQAQILSHGSIGGFLTHCGWNSTLESVVNGVPLIAWPLYAEQKMNAFMLTEDTKAALRPKANENDIVEREEIARVVKALIDGEEGQKLRNRMKDLKKAALEAVSEDGASTKALAEVVYKWKSLICN
ncbi:Hydroquinone glucosyltransferase [Morus notabilis]|uniref:Glycosyltransferase n=1 Tax=Morus notabilis TaxID=981085 RepID=W9RK16_9ROSA|nr:hydroquinone glucosyltransferase [Morus notabilis]EXB77511.1 Hydroquinone glucosyltransferase [Morus notabilis]